MQLDELKYYTRPQLYWICKCDCGTIKSIRGCTLIKRTRSCGCIQKEKAAITGNATGKFTIEKLQKDLFVRHVKGAKLRKIDFEIPFDFFTKIINEDCYYCGDAPYSSIIHKYKNDLILKWNGMDRTNPDLGYTIDNVVPCCPPCNYAKLKQSKYAFLNWVKKVYEYQGLKYE